jgi:hypothetical protein
VKIEARCVENGWQLEHVYIDAGVSGSSGERDTEILPVWIARAIVGLAYRSPCRLSECVSHEGPPVPADA